MQTKFSAYLTRQKPALKKLLNVLLAKYEFASILSVDAEAKRYSISSGGTNISVPDMLAYCGAVVKVYDGRSYGEYSFNEISEENIEGIVSKIDNVLLPLSENFATNHYNMLLDTPLVFSKCTDCEIDPATYGDNKIIEQLTQHREQAMSSNDKVLDCRVGCSYQKYSKLYLSRSRDMEQSVMWTDGYVMVMASRGEEIKDCFRSFSGVGGIENLSNVHDMIPEAVDTCIELLDSEPIIPGEYDCVCTPTVTGMIVHEAFGHGVEMDMFVKDRALAKSYMGKQVASPLITMHDSASDVNQTATYFFDDEGTLAHDTVIIDKGILVNGISDAQSAMYLGTEPTGNGRRENYSRKAYTRMTNTFFIEGNDKADDMISSIKYGFLLDAPSSGMEDPKNWGIQCMVSFAREIRDGKFTGKIFSPIVLTGYVPDLLKSISMVSENVELSGSGFCGKGYKEWVKVSDGGPYIKAKIRLG